ncbi:MAG: aminoacyl-tRNA hydrolase [Acidimicrobiia bacterium]
MLIVGLGNPGPDYLASRHNVGQEVVGALARRWGISFRRAPGRIRGQVAEGGPTAARAILALPRTFVNESGSAVGPLLRYYDVPLAGLVLVHDDIDLPFGRLRFQHGRGSGGHRGVDSVAAVVGGLEFSRLKIGVGRPPSSMDPADYVLRPFQRRERAEVDLLVEDGADVLEVYISSGLQRAVSRASQRTTP